MTLLHLEKFSKLAESREPPIALLGDEPVVGVCDRWGKERILVIRGYANATKTRTRDSVDGRVCWIGDDQSKLRAGVPTFGRPLWVSIVEVDGDRIVRWRVGIAERE